MNDSEGLKVFLYFFHSGLLIEKDVTKSRVGTLAFLISNLDLTSTTDPTWIWGKTLMTIIKYHLDYTLYYKFFECTFCTINFQIPILHLKL